VDPKVCADQDEEEPIIAAETRSDTIRWIRSQSLMLVH
jgi:hypothetical protein